MPDSHGYPNVKKELGKAFVDWIVSREEQKAIADYRIAGEQLFFSERGEMNGRRALYSRPWTG